VTVGYTKHDAVIATVLGMDMPDDIDEFRRSLPPEIRRLVIGPFDDPTGDPAGHGYATYVFLPDGSKEGWPLSDVADKARERFKELFGEGRWVHVVYGGDVERGHHAAVVEVSPVADGRTERPHLAERPRAEWTRQRIVADLVLRLASCSMPLANALSEAFEAGRAYEAGVEADRPSTGLALSERGGVLGLIDEVPDDGQR
jgi:hypothetical protein